MRDPTTRPGLPPLNALRAFEAAARLGSFSDAAAELYVTPAAVAQQIKSLESWAGLRLFDRHPQGITLSDRSKPMVPRLTAAFDLLGEASHELLRTAKPHAVKIAALPSIAQFWLAPRLTVLRQAIPNVEISVSTLEEPPNLKREPYDVSLFFEDADPEPDKIILGQDHVFPVCTPEIANRLNTPADLRNETLLHDQKWRSDWYLWFSKTQTQQLPDLSGPIFSLYGLALEEAKNGAGVVIGHSLLIENYLANNALVIPFTQKLTLDRSLCLRVASLETDDLILSRIVEILSNSMPRNDR